MSSEIKVSPQGLYSQPNQVGSDIPDGAMVTADNVVINREGIIESRRGVSGYATATANHLVSYQDRIISHTSTGTLSYDNGSGTFTAITGTFAPPHATTAKTKTTEAGKNLLLTTSNAPYRMDSFSAVPALSGAIKATGFDRDGRVYTAAIAAMSLTTNVVSVTTNEAHGFYVGQIIAQTGGTVEAPYANGTYQIITTPTSTTFTYGLTAGNDAANANTHTFAPATLREATIGTPGGGFLADGYQVAYRCYFNCPDANNLEKPGSASPRTIIQNATGTVGWVTTEARNVVVRAFVPSGIIAGHVIRLYRSKQVATTIDPGEELQLCYEAYVRPFEITQGWMDVTDVCPDTSLDEVGYFVPSQQGLIANNERPPLCKDLCSFGGSVHYANTTELKRFNLTLLACGAPNGLQDGKAITINSTYTAKTTPTDTKHFKLETAGSASANIRDTALNFVAAINRDTASTYSALYVSNQGDAPGKILLEGKTQATVQVNIYVTGTRGCWSPLLNPTSAGLTLLGRTSNVVTATFADHNFVVGDSIQLSEAYTSFAVGPFTVLTTTATTITWAEAGSNVAAALPGPETVYVQINTTLATITDVVANQNRVYHSKVNLHEAVPLLNYNDIGSKGAALLRLIPMRDSVIAFKEDGIFRGTGSNGEFEWRLLDATVLIVGPNTADTMNNRIYCLTTNGVIEISESGSQVISKPIKLTLDKLLNADLASVKSVSFGLCNDIENTYELRTISAASETTCTQAFIYNATSGIWTRDTIETKCGIMHSDNLRYLGGASKILKERKAYAYTDYSDVDISVTINSGGATSAPILVSATGVAAGDILVQGANYARITAVVSNTLTLAASDAVAYAAMTNAAATVKKAIACTVQWAPITGGKPGTQKLWQEENFILGNGHLALATVSNATELVPTFADISVDGESTIGQWVKATTTWDATERPFNLRVSTPQEMRRSCRMNLKFAVTQAWAAWNISGLKVLHSGETEVSSK